MNNALIYILESDINYYKIGVSNNLKQRIATFEVKLPFEIKILHKISCNEDTVYHWERWLHNFFREKRVNGEWFLLDYFCLKLLIEYLEDEQDLKELQRWFYDDYIGELREFGITVYQEAIWHFSGRKTFDLAFASTEQIKDQINKCSNRLFTATML